MSRRERDDVGLDVEEIEVDAWGNPAARDLHASAPPLARAPAPSTDGWASGPPSASRAVDESTGGWSSPATGDGASAGARALAWLRSHTKAVVAGAAAVVTFAAIVAIATGPGSEPEAAPTTPPSTVPPSTTERRPIATPTTPPPPTEPTSPAGGGSTVADAEAFRFVLDGLPEDFQVTDASLIPADARWDMPQSGATMFAADGATWDAGPWLLVLANRTGRGSMLGYQFSRPPLEVPIGDLTGRVGTAYGGLELTTFAGDGTDVSVVARGLPSFTTVAVAEALTVGGGNAALPAGLRARPDLDVIRWQSPWHSEVRASVSYEDTAHGVWLSVTASPISAGAWTDGAGFFLSDVRYLVNDGGTGVAGRYRSGPGDDGPVWAVWQHAGHEYVASADGMELDELVGYVAGIVQVGDDGWNDGRWRDLRDAVGACCRVPPDEPSVHDDVRTGSLDGEWTATIDVGKRTSWALTEDPTAGGVFGLMVDSTDVPTLRIDAAADWWGADQTFHAMAVALVDRGRVGARLQLTTTGTDGTTVAVELAPVEGTPYLSAAAVLPWHDGGFVAQLVDADGRVFAVQTDAELP